MASRDEHIPSGESSGTPTESPAGAPLSGAKPGEAVRASEEQFRLLVESVADYAIFLMDTEGNIVTWNKGAQRINGYRADEIIGRHFSIFYTPEDVERGHPQEELVTAIAEGRFEEEGWRVRKDGTHFQASVVISAMYNDAGFHCGFSKVTRDITERKKAEQDRLRQMRDHVSRAFLRDILFSVTEGKLRLCEDKTDLPKQIAKGAKAEPFNRAQLAHVRRELRDIACSVGFPDERIMDLMTGVGEASMNAVMHARNSRFLILVNPAGTMIQVWIIDKGAGIELTKLHRATLERGFTTGESLGHGFWLMLKTCDRLWLHSTSAGTTIVLEQEIDVPIPHWLSAEKFSI